MAVYSSCTNQKVQSYTKEKGSASFAGEFGETGATDTNWLLGGGQRNRVRGTGLAEDVTEGTTEYTLIIQCTCT